MKVRIYQPHTHAGVAYAPGPEGIEIDVSATDAAFLKQLGKLARPHVAAPAAGKMPRFFAASDTPDA